MQWDVTVEYIAEEELSSSHVTSFLSARQIKKYRMMMLCVAVLKGVESKISEFSIHQSNCIPEKKGRSQNTTDSIFIYII